MCVLGMAGELADSSVAVNALWPRTSIDTAAVQNLPKTCTGNFFIDDEVLASENIHDLRKYKMPIFSTLLRFHE